MRSSLSLPLSLAVLLALREVRRIQEVEAIHACAADAVTRQLGGAADFTALSEGENPVISFTRKKCASHK